MSFFYFQLFLFLILCFLLMLLSWLWPPHSPWAPWWRTSKKRALAVCKLAKITKKDTVYELGSGEGNVLFVAAKTYGAFGVGVEIEPARAWLSKIDMWFRGVSHLVQIRRGDLFKQNISDATVVFVYLVPKTLKRLRTKFLKELKPGTKIVSLRYTIANWEYETYDAKNELYLYRIPKRKDY